MKDFVSCKLSDIILDTTKVEWVPKLPGGFGPSISVEPGGTPNHVTIKYGLASFPATIGPDGELVIDVSSAGPLADGVTSWVNAFNATMKENSKGLTDLSVSGTRLKLTKAQTVVATTESAIPAGGTIVTPPEPPVEPPPPKPEPKSEVPWWNPGCSFLLMAIVVAVVAVIAGFVYLVTRGGGDSVAVTPPVTQSAVDDPSSGAPPITDTPSPQPDPQPDPPPQAAATTTTEEPVSVPAFTLEADMFAFSFETGDAWNVGESIHLGSEMLGSPIDGYLFLRNDPVAAGSSFFGFLQTPSNGALEVFSFDSKTGNQVGITPFFGGRFPTFGTGEGEGLGIQCAGNGLVFGTFLGQDPRLGSSFGTTLYTDLGEGMTGAFGAVLGDQAPSPIRFDIDPNAWAISSGLGSLDDPLADCLEDMSVADKVLMTDFFQRPVDGAAVTEVGDPTGDEIAAALDESGDVTDCSTGAAISVPGADIVEMVVTGDGSRIEAQVRMMEPPTETAGSTSFAVIANATNPSGVRRNFIWQVHEGEFTTGELDGNGAHIPDADVEITLTEEAVVFNYGEPGEAPTGFEAASFNLVANGDPTGCDEATA
jgi:hypothetical protein